MTTPQNPTEPTPFLSLHTAVVLPAAAGASVPVLRGLIR